jgi:hypothetical protein
MSDLLKTLESIRLDLTGVRTDVGSMRAEANAAHLEMTKQIDGLSERLALVNARTAAMERRPRWTAGIPRLVVGSVAAVAKAAMLGK